MNDNIKIGFLGDTVFPIEMSASEEILNSLNKNDFNICNLESAALFENDFESVEPYKIIRLYSDPDYLITGLNKLNVKLATLANNHFFDLGNINTRKTLVYLDENDIKYSGITELNDSARTNYSSINVRGIVFGVLSYGWNVIGCRKKVGNYLISDIEETSILADVKKVRDKVDFLCISMHWGYEFELYPQPAHRNLAHKLIDAGVDVIIGHHSHMMQGVEEYKGKLIVYGLGNFNLPQIDYLNNSLNYTRESAELGMVINLDISSNMTYTYDCIGVRYHKEDEHKLTLESIDLTMISDFSKLDYNQYLNFFRINRQRKGLPIFKGNKFDYIKAKFVTSRQKFIELLVRFKIRRVI